MLVRSLAPSLVVAFGLAGVGCKTDDEPAADPAPGAWDPPPAVPAVAPEPARPPEATENPRLPPAVGFPCATDGDALCPFAHCIGGRCGGCSDSSACKPNAQCFPTWFGNACLPAATPAAPTAAAPAPPAATPVAKYRARVGVPGLVPRPDQEACAGSQAQSDAASGRAHGAFGRCRVSAQNECPGWRDALEVVDRWIRCL